MDRIYRFFTASFIVFLALLLLAECLYPFTLVSPFAASLGTVSVLTVLLWMFAKRDRLSGAADRLTGRFSNISREKMLGILFAVSFALRLLSLLILTSDCSVHYDIGIYLENASEIRSAGYVLTHGNYTANYPHLFWFALLLSPLSGTGNSVLASCVLMALLDSVSLLLLASAFMRRYPKEKIFAVSLLPALLPGEVLSSSFITHEHALLFFLALALDLYAGSIGKSGAKKTLLRALSFLSLSLSTLFNASGLVAVIAFLILSVTESAGRRTLKPLLPAVSLLTVLLCVSFTAFLIEGSRIVTDPSYIPRDKVVWTLYVGAGRDSSGTWNREDEISFDSCPVSFTADGEIYSLWQKELMKERYRELGKDPAGTLKLLKEKLTSTWGCFSYPLSFLNETVEPESLRTVYTKVLFRPLILIQYAVTLAGTLWCFMKASSGRKKRTLEPVRFVSGLYVMGTAAMLLITECTSKYTMAALPFLWLVTAAMSEKEDRCEV